MRTHYDPGLKATVTWDDAGRVRGILHLDEYREMENLRGRAAAEAYVRGIAGNLDIPPEALRNLEQPVTYLDPCQQVMEYRFSEEKIYFELGHLRLLSDVSQHAGLGGTNHSHAQTGAGAYCRGDRHQRAWL